MSQHRYAHQPRQFGPSDAYECHKPKPSLAPATTRPANQHSFYRASRYGGSRYDGDRRSRSPRDRSPYGDRTSQYGDADRRRSSAESRNNTNAFQANRDSFRDSLTGREPPRGPKALIDPPSGPRGTNDFRGGRGGRGRGRGWRDDSRDRNDRGRDSDYRDRPHFREERSREREWDRRERDRDGFRVRRPLSPQGRGRASPPRELFRDGPLNVDADRARRESRGDGPGPLSAGSSNSDPPFGQSFRGGLSRGRGGRGRGDWDRGRGRGFYDDQDRYGPRSRSQEGRWGRDRDDRDRRDRYQDSSRDIRDDRDPRIRDDRDLIRPKVDRVSHEPTSAKDVSPPPIAPSAPAFGSVPVPSRQASTADIQSLTGKAPPTGPRAMGEERPVSSGGSERLPPTGPSKATIPDASPSIPVGPRAQQQKQQQQQQRSSKQWINPNLQGKKGPDSPKMGRSQSFVSQQPRPFGSYRPESSHSDQTPAEFDRRPRRSSDAQSDSHLGAPDGQLRRYQMGEPNDVAVRSERGTPSARASVDREGHPATPAESKMDVDREPLSKDQDGSKSSNRSPSPSLKPVREHRELDDEPEEGEAIDSPRPLGSEASEPTDGIVLDAPSAFLIAPEPAAVPEDEIRAVVDEVAEEEEDEEVEQESSESEEDMDEYFEEQMAQVNTDLEKVEAGPEILPEPLFDMYERVKARASIRHALEEDSFESLIGSFPEDFEFPRSQRDDQTTEIKDAEGKDETKDESRAALVSERHENPTAPTTVESNDNTTPAALDLQPKMEEMEMDGIGVPALPIAEHAKADNGDIDMNDVTETQDTVGPLPEAPPVNGVHGEKNNESPSQFGPTTSVRTSPEVMDEDSEDKTEDDASVYGSIEAVREFSATPPTEDLPIYLCKPWHESKKLRRSLNQENQFNAFVIGQLRNQYAVKSADQHEAKEAYSNNYEFYLRFTISDDPTAVKSRNFFASSSVPLVTNGKPSAAPESKPEGRRGRYATELDLESVLQQSMREHEEKQEREARAEREKHRTDKEAVIPDMYWTSEEREHEFFFENAGFLPVEKLVSTWQVLPPKIDFTEEEAQKFETSYLQNPKQWGKIANEVPNRDFKSCIMYYYAKKKELNLKEKLKKQPRRRKKNKKQASSALISELKNTENETEENPENETGDKPRRPRRAAAPTFGYEATPAADSEGNTPTATPGRRRGAAASENKQEGEKTESKRGGRRARQPKADKEKAKPPIIAPQPPAAKAGRSRSNSRAQGPTEWTPATVPQSSGPELGRLPTAFEVPSIGMQAPIMPVQQPPLASPERAPAQSTISEVMAPPSLRPEPPPPPPSSSVATFDIGAHDRNRTPMQASSYWSVAEVNDFPGLLRSFGTEWNKIADHMQSKTPVMVKNYFVRQKDSVHPDWEVIANDADTLISRGEATPAPPTPSAAPRKRYDGSLGQRASAGRDVEPSPTPGAPFKTSFRVPIAQASPQSAPQSTPPPMPQPVPPVQQPVAAQAASQIMSPTNRPLRPPVAPFTFPERDVEQGPSKPLAQATPISQQSASVPSPTQAPPQQPQQGQIPDTTGARPQWPAEASSQLSILTPQKDNFRESRLSHKVREHALRPEVQSGKPNERVPLILKQEPDIHQYEPPTYGTAAQPQPSRAPARNEPVPIPRQAEPPRNVAPVAPPQQPSYQPPPAQALRMAFDQQRHPTPPQQPTASVDRPMPGVSRPTPVDPYGAVAPPNPPPSAPPVAAPAPAGPPRKSNLMALLNDDPPAPASTPAPAPKRVNDVSIGIKSASTPPPGPIVTRPPQPPPSAPPTQRRETEMPGYPYSRNPPSSIPPLKPFHTQSPQPTHMNAPRSQMVSPIDSSASASAQEREYYNRVAYQQHPASANNPPPSHYPPPGQHAQQPQQAPMGYQQPPPYPSYPVSQPHSASPTPQYAPHSSISGRRDAPPVTREPWPQAQPAGAPLQHQQQQAWPPPKQQQQVPVQSAWAAQHGGTPKQISAPVPPPQQPQHAWPPAQPQPSHLSMRDDPHSRSSSIYGVHDTRSPGGMVQHQHHSSMSGRYPADPRDPRRPEPGPPPAQPPYPRYSTPGPQQGRDPGPGPGPGRSYTPVNQYDPRGPPPAQYQDQLRDPQLRELVSRDPREMAAREREAAAQAQHQAQQQAQHASLLPRHLRPPDGYDRVPDRRY